MFGRSQFIKICNIICKTDANFSNAHFGLLWIAKQSDALNIFLRKKSFKKVRDLFSFGMASDEKMQQKSRLKP